MVISFFGDQDWLQTSAVSASVHGAETFNASFLCKQKKNRLYWGRQQVDEALISDKQQHLERLGMKNLINKEVKWKIQLMSNEPTPQAST